MKDCANHSRRGLLLITCVGMALLMACAPEDEGGDTSGCVRPDEVVYPGAALPVQPGTTKVVARDGQVYEGIYTIGQLNQEYDRFVEHSGDVAPAFYFTFFDWATERGPDGEPVLNDLDDPLGEDEPSVRELATQLAEDDVVLALAWSSVGYFFEDPTYWLGNDTRLVTFEDIMSGRYDTYIRSMARQFRDLGLPIMLSPFAEINSTANFSYGANGYTDVEATSHLCNNYGDPGLPDGPERLRDAYVYVVNIFREEQVQNVTWFMYAATNYQNPEVYAAGPADYRQFDHPAYYYPGDDVVDWVGNSVYPTDQELGLEDVGDLSFALEDGVSAWREVTDKPFFAPEFAVLGDGRNSRADYMEEVFAQLPDMGVSAFTMAQAEVFELLFSSPRLGKFDDEVAIWQRDVIQNPRYSTQVALQTVETP